MSNKLNYVAGGLIIAMSLWLLIHLSEIAIFRYVTIYENNGYILGVELVMMAGVLAFGVWFTKRAWKQIKRGG